MTANFSLKISEDAYKKISSVLHKKEQPSYFKINITSGGCSGFSTSFDIVHNISVSDLQIKHNDITVLIDKNIAHMLQSANLMYKSDILNSYFVLDVDNATDKCSCGSSFGL